MMPGFDYMECNAARETGQYVGYNIWPKMGYDQEIHISAATRRSSNFPLAGKMEGRTRANVSEILDAPGGLKWWRRHGRNLEAARFDLSQGSASWQRLGKYMKKKGL